MEQNGTKSEAGDVFKDVGVFHGFGSVLSPGEGGMTGNEDARDGDGVKIAGAEAAHDDGTGVADVGFGYFLGGEWLGNGDGSVKVVGMGGAETRDGAAGLRP